MTNNLVRLEAFFAGRGFSSPVISVLQPANPFLDTAGEDMRRRIFITADGAGRALCLRPEFTIPVCLAHLDQNEDTANYAYGGTVFRQNRQVTMGEAGAAEFLQAGIEAIGGTDIVISDVTCVTTALDALTHCGVREQELRVVMGDQALFESLLIALRLPQAWRQRLARGFGDARKLESDLEAIANPDAQAGDLDTDLARALQSNDVSRVEALIREKMTAANLPFTGGRIAKDIAARMISKAQLAASRLSDHQQQCLNKFLSLEVNLSEGVDCLKQFAAQAQIEFDPAIALFDARAKALAQRAGNDVEIIWRARFGRPLDYYTGIVFEIFRGQGKEPVCGGGRYDHLMNMLGARGDIPAIGFSIFLDQLTGDA